ncbi:hypothetical protein WNY59_02210 [Ahrensia kielensis]|uniref:Uncharacterized protein n=1 Tax=Ahrensia kielensis TaxID=76980 RepID=A0ABU9T2P1_9HYPH
MHYLFYGIGAIAMIPSAYLLYWSMQSGGVIPLQWSAYLFLQAWLWLAIGRGLELLKRIADAVAPIKAVPHQSVDTIDVLKQN